jgi:acetyl esterase/lipase
VLEPVVLPASPMRPVLRAFLRIAVRGFALRLPLRLQRRAFAMLTVLQPRPRGTTVEAMWLSGIPAERSREPRRARKAAILYVHGGGFCTLGPRSYRALAARLARDAAADVYAIDYRLAPEHPYPAALDDTLAAFAWLRREGYGAERVAFAGDSAGGGLVLAALLRLRDRGEPLPAAAALISPWIDLRCSNASFDEVARRDPILVRRSILAWAQAYGGPSLHGAELTGLPPLLVYAGSDEVLLDDARNFAERAAAAGCSVAGRCYAGLWHIFPNLAGLLPEAGDAIAELGAFVRKHTAAEA